MWIPADRLLQRCGLIALTLLALAGLSVLVRPARPVAQRRPALWRVADEDATDGEAKDEQSDAARTLPQAAVATATERLDPAAWGEDHVDQPVPEYVESGECLFCHRSKVGRDWQKNRHAVTIHDAVPGGPELKPLEASPHAAVAGEVTLVVGHQQHVRYLKRSERYGQLDLLTVGASGGRGGRFRLSSAEAPAWDHDHFAARCAGCHTTAVDPETAAFAAPSLDCFACHGDATEEHANDPALMPLARQRKDPPRVVTAICAQCHLRHGRSRATGRPYATNFVAGDNLFKDFEIDWDAADDPSLNTADRHVLANVRDVALFGREEMTCLSCHTVHASDSKRHRELPDGPYCQICHEPGRPKTEFIRSEVHSPLCEY